MVNHLLQLNKDYSSITSDDDNIYVLYEGKVDHNDIFMKVIDYKHKEYANLNTQTLNRSNNLNYMQNTFASAYSYI